MTELPANVTLTPVTPYGIQHATTDHKQPRRYAVDRDGKPIGYVLTRSERSTATRGKLKRRAVVYTRWWTFDPVGGAVPQGKPRATTRTHAVLDLLEHIDSATGNAPETPASQPRTFGIAAAPEDLAAVLDSAGSRWEPHGCHTHWFEVDSGVIAEWGNLVYHYGPLTEVLER